MIQREFYAQRKDGIKLYRTCSDAGMMIRQTETGVEYTEAIDVEGAPYTYTETETPIETPEMTTEERLQDAETALGIIFGEAE
jgi:hypothetical protein